MNRDQCRGAGGADVDGGAGEVQLVRDAGGEELRIGGQAQLELARGVRPIELTEQILMMVGALRGAGEDADAAGALRGHPAGILQCPPGRFEQQPMLRIEPGGLTRQRARRTPRRSTGNRSARARS